MNQSRYGAAFLFIAGTFSTSTVMPMHRASRYLFSAAALFACKASSADRMKTRELTPLQRISSAQEFQKHLEDRSTSGEKPFHITCMSYNMCNVPTHPAFQNNSELYDTYRWSARLDRMVNLIKDENPDILGLQEIRNDKDVYAVAKLWEKLAPLGYEIITFRSNASSLSFSNVIAYNPQRVALDRVSRYWSSETPDKNSNTWGNGWGRVSLVATFYPSTAKDVQGQRINLPDYDHPPLHYINVHNGLGDKEKLESNKVHVAQAQKLIAEKDGIVIVGGDFNNFNDNNRSGREEMAIFEEAAFCDLPKPLKTAEGVAVSGTFPGYEYDPYRSPEGTFGAQLDHMHCLAATPDHDVAFWSYVNAKRYNGNPEKQAQTEADLLKNSDSSADDRNFPSDHLPIITHLVITPGEKVESTFIVTRDTHPSAHRYYWVS